MLRQLIKINQELCTGCGLCVDACHEGAIALIDGKATLLRDDYCDGLGNCLPVCPTEAISFEEREAQPYNQVGAPQPSQTQPLACGCPGSHSKTLVPPQAAAPTPGNPGAKAETQLQQWPVQIKLVPINAPYFEGAKLLIAADCAAYAYGNFHQDFMKNKITLIGCPKLDEGDYSQKLTEILKQNQIRSVTVVRMEVPCCTGLENALKTALQSCGKIIPWQAITISTHGKILED